MLFHNPHSDDPVGLKFLDHTRHLATRRSAKTKDEHTDVRVRVRTCSLNEHLPSLSFRRCQDFSFQSRISQFCVVNHKCDHTCFTSASAYEVH